MKNFRSYLILAPLFIATQSLHGGQTYSVPKENYSPEEIHIKHCNCGFSYKNFEETPIIIASYGTFSGTYSTYYVADLNNMGRYIYVGISEQAAINYIKFMKKNLAENKNLEIKEDTGNKEADTENK